ncbi:glutamate--cysteine ligase [Porticoccus sp. W117]|uniref:glutamate--cysteine ligase n=1 Tax=Porticoccus sp. W117 TaxID=3054777 RepID=UPI0025922015|nr:glutamate--cysteine ligase [Porticoccus sp. W117]MDM3872577.1 glutamate--cysteine ligase [Porticoccus sp. W117]
MGTGVTDRRYTDKDFLTFQARLDEQLQQLKQVLQQPGFGSDPLHMGAELEMYLADAQGSVSQCNQNLLDALGDSQFQPELNQYNIELNLSAFAIGQNPLEKLHNEMQAKTAKLEAVAARQGVDVIPIGILPTLRREHLHKGLITPLPRYHSLATHLYQQRGEDFTININGADPLSVSFADISAEGANTSFQVHCMVPPECFVQVFNAAQLTAPLVVAVAANSPVFLGHRLWDETRIALFKQSLDVRQRGHANWRQPTRVNFGFGWLRHSPWELFAEAVALYPVVLPAVDSNLDDNDLPSLKELLLHIGTIWSWHRPVYCPSGSGHVRIEFRAIPAGPTSIDMMANAAFAIGLAMGLADRIDDLISFVPFRFAEYNFYRAAQAGLDSKLLWPVNGCRPQETDITAIIEQLLPVAQQGLEILGIANGERYLKVIEERLQQRMTGARWQRQALDYYSRKSDRDSACQKMLRNYLQQCRSAQPVSQWERPWNCQ